MILNDKQKNAVFNLSGNTLVTASPGSGKTRTLVARAEYNLDKLEKHKAIALITYTNAGADEIESRLNINTNIFIGTIHSFCLEFILRPFGWIYKWNRPKIISYDLKELFFEENKNIILDREFGQNKFDELDKIQKKIDGNLNTEIEWNHELTLDFVAEKYYEFQEKNKVIDFNEILYRSYKIVTENEFVSKSLSSKFYEILVDEFQDTNLYQYEILKIINNNGECKFFMVGDERQKIFSFAGAIDNAFHKAEKDFNSDVKILTETYRSTDKIVEAYTKLFDDHPEIDNKSENKNLDLKVHIIETKKANHKDIINDIVGQFTGKLNFELSEIAILSTSWFSAFPVSKELRLKYDIVGLGALPHKYINHSSINLLKSLSRYLFLPNIRGLRSIKRNIDMHLLENDIVYSDKILINKTNDLISKIIEMDLNIDLENGLLEIKNIFEKIFIFSHPVFGEILSKIDEDEKSEWTISKYLKTLAGNDGITSNTIHKVKGLEFDVVILNEMNENKIPYQKCISTNPWEYEALNNDGINEGRNLFYVATSRAKKHLIILHNWKPSMFIEIVK